MTKYKCDKCELTVNSKRDIPLEHGKMGIVIYPKQNHSYKCDGKFIEITDSEISHILPSGADNTLCGLDSDKANCGSFSSLGMSCNCERCLEIANKIIMGIKVFGILIDAELSKKEINLSDDAFKYAATLIKEGIEKRKASGSIITELTQQFDLK